MRQKRAKQYRKNMKALHAYFKFREPYQVLVDEEIVLEAVRTKYDLVKGLNSVLQGQIKPMITQCAMEALYKTKNQDAIALAKNFERRRCGHLPRQGGEDVEEKQKQDGEEGTKSAFDCLKSVVNINGKNKHRYVVATQKVGLRKVFKTIPAVPMIFLHRSVIIMEPMADITKRAIALVEQQKLTGGLNDPLASVKVDEEEEGEEGGEQPTPKKRKGPKAPNPLSMKRRKPETGPDAQPKALAAKKRRRKHKRGPAQAEEGGNEAGSASGSE